MNRIFEAIDAGLQGGKSIFQRSKPAVQLRVRKANHRADFDEFPLHLDFQTLDLLSICQNPFGDGPDLACHSFDPHVEMPPRLRVCRGTVLPDRLQKLPQLVVHPAQCYLGSPLRSYSARRSPGTYFHAV